MANSADGWYDRTKPWNAPPPYTYLRPWATNEERLTQQALDAALITRADLTDIVRPPISMVQTFRPRFGYRTEALSVNDILDVSRAYEPPVISNYSGSPAGYQGSDRYGQSPGQW